MKVLSMMTPLNDSNDNIVDAEPPEATAYDELKAPYAVISSSKAKRPKGNSSAIGNQSHACDELSTSDLMVVNDLYDSYQQSTEST